MDAFSRPPPVSFDGVAGIGEVVCGSLAGDDAYPGPSPAASAVGMTGV